MSAPFGIELGSSLERYRVLEEANDHRFWIEAPRPHPEFPNYAVQATPATGIVWVKGVGRTQADDPYGHRVQAAFAELQAQLTHRYGQPELVDVLMPGALWDQPRDWVMALSQGERYLFAKWDGHPVRSAGLESIGLVVSSPDGYSAWVSAEYESPLQNEVERQLKADLADLL